MAKKLYTDFLYDSLQAALEEGIIQYWTVEGCNVVFIRDGDAVAVPVMEAGPHLSELCHRHVRAAEQPEHVTQ